MEISEALSFFDPYALWLVVLGIGVLATVTLPQVLERHPFSMPIALLLLGIGVATLPLGLEGSDPLSGGALIEHLTELGVIVSLMGAGLKIDRPLSWRGWNVTLRLLTVTMLLSVALCALTGWWLAGFVPATAVLLGAVIAPTDPVLASELQVAEPTVAEDLDEPGGQAQEKEHEVRFALTSEAGLNDGLAFPFTQMAIAMALVGAHPSGWFGTWLLVDVFYKIIVGVMVGWAAGVVLARVLLRLPTGTEFSRGMIGLGALAATLILYGVTEAMGGYGFLATFVGAMAIRRYEREHRRHKQFHMLAEKMERLFSALILIGLGAAVGDGLLDHLTWPLVLAALVIVFVVRPLAGIAGLAGCHWLPWRERWTISFFGIRGIGSLYYLAYALNHAPFEGGRALWSLVALVVVISVVVHGVLAAPVMRYVTREPGV